MHEMWRQHHITTILWHFSGTTRVSRCQKKVSSGLYGAREDNKTQTHNNLGGHHSIRTNQLTIALCVHGASHRVNKCATSQCNLSRNRSPRQSHCVNKASILNVIVFVLFNCDIPSVGLKTENFQNKHNRKATYIIKLSISWLISCFMLSLLQLSSTLMLHKKYHAKITFSKISNSNNLTRAPYRRIWIWRSSGPQVAVVISRSVRLNASCWTLTHTRHTTDPLRGAHSRCLGLASNYCITADFHPRY